MKKGKRAEEKAPLVQKLSQTFSKVPDFIKKNKRLSILAGAAFLAITLSIAAIFALNFGNKPEEHLPSPTPVPSEGGVISGDSTPEPQPHVYAYLNPLTGLPFTDDEDLAKSRPAAVMHNNYYNGPSVRNHALPMFGLSKADVIYEVIAEGATTRMLAVYQDIASVPQLGAIRSTRRYYVELAFAYDAFLVHFGGSDQSYDDIRNWKAENIDGHRGGEGSRFWEDSGRKNSGVSLEHRRFTSGENIAAAITARYNRRTVSEAWDNGLYFSSGAVLSGSPANMIKVNFNSSNPGKSTTFRYNEDDKLYYAEQYNMALDDGENGEQVAVTNLLILQTSISVIPGDTEGRRRVDLQTDGTGYYASGGQYIPITWSRGGTEEPFRYFAADGEPLVMTPGKSYICIIPKNQGDAAKPAFE